MFSMPIQINFIKASPENDPFFSEKSRKVALEWFSKRDGLLKKHGIKSIGSWNVPAEHLSIFVAEASSLDAFQKLMMEPEYIAFLGYVTVETKVALSMDDATKMLKQAKQPRT
jgi:hypothetical protein